MSLPTFEPIGHAVPHSLQEAAGMMRNTETKKVELRPHRYLRECDVLKEMRMIKDKLDEYEKCQDAQRQAPVDAELVERMVMAFIANCPTIWATYKQRRIGMTAALRVAADAMLADPTAGEVLAFRREFPRMPDPIAATFECYIRFRRARILAPAKTPEERVKKFCHATKWCVVVDANRDHPLTAYNMDGKVADAYYEQVITMLKQEGK